MSNPLATTIISESRTLWIGDVESWMDESYIASLFNSTGSVQSVKVIRDKNTGLPAGYGFVEFSSHEVASQILACYNGVAIPGTNKTFRLNWGIFGGGTKANQLPTNANAAQKTAPTAGSSSSPDYSIYVGDLDPQVTDAILVEFFQKRYHSVLSAKVIVDPITKYSKGYGFVKFSLFEESQRAISEMQGSLLRGRHIKTSQSFWKSAGGAANEGGYPSSTVPNTAPIGYSMPGNANMYYGSYYNNVPGQSYGYYNNGAYGSEQGYQNYGYSYDASNNAYDNYANYQQNYYNLQNKNPYVMGSSIQNNMGYGSMYGNYQQNDSSYPGYNYQNFGNKENSNNFPTNANVNTGNQNSDGLKLNSEEPKNNEKTNSKQDSQENLGPDSEKGISKKINNFEDDLEFAANQTKILQLNFHSDLELIA